MEKKKKEESCEIWRRSWSRLCVKLVPSYDVLEPEFSQGCGTRRNTPYSQLSVEIRISYTLARGQRQDPKRRYHKRLELADTLQETDPVVPESYCHQKQPRSFLKIGDLNPTPHT